MPDAICFDHDLGNDEYNGLDPHLIENEKTGYDCAKWLVDYCMDHQLSLPQWNIQSSNPVGKANINGLLLSFSKNVR